MKRSLLLVKFKSKLYISLDTYAFNKLRKKRSFFKKVIADSLGYPFEY